MTIPLTKPDLQEQDLSAMVECVRAGSIEQGALVSRFETAFAQTVGARGAVATNSATSAIVLGLRALDVDSRHEVILPSYTCQAVLHAVVQSGATPILVDSSCNAIEMDYNMAVAHIEPALSNRTRAIIIPHMFGVAADVLAIRQLQIPVIEDITLSVGAEGNSGHPVGSMGDLAVCSFHSSKMLACGEGGMLLARDEDLLLRARALNHWEDEQVKHRLGGPVQPYALHYNFRLSDVHAACGLSQVSRLPDFIRIRRALAQRYATALQSLDNVVLPDVNLPGRVYFRFIVFVQHKEMVNVLKGFENFGIEAGRGVYPPLHHFLGLSKQEFPGAEAAISGALSIPLYPALKEDEVCQILDAANKVLGNS